MKWVQFAPLVLLGGLAAFAVPRDDDAPQPSVAKPAQEKAVEKVAVEKVAALQRVAIVGASLSAGFRIDGGKDPFQPSRLQLADVVDASLLAPHESVSNLANPGFFLDPEGTRKASIEGLRAYKPTLVVALDYLFWFAHGMNVAEDKRLSSVEGALADLATFDCPILLGDLPDMSGATKVALPMLRKGNLPAPETLEKMNAAIAKFAKEHANVVVVPLADVTKKLLSDEELVVRDVTWPKGSIGLLMQKDRLHPTLEGTCAVWVVAVDRWLAHAKPPPATAFELDAKKLARVLTERLKVQAVPAGAPGK